MKTAVIVAGFFLFLPSAANAASSQMDGNAILEKCEPLWSHKPMARGSKVELDAVYCKGYLDGLLDSQAMEFATNRDNRGQTGTYCRPENAVNGQVYKVLKKWLDENPDKLHWRADTIVRYALRDAFPCNP